MKQMLEAQFTGSFQGPHRFSELSVWRTFTLLHLMNRVSGDQNSLAKYSGPKKKKSTYLC